MRYMLILFAVFFIACNSENNNIIVEYGSDMEEIKVWDKDFQDFMPDYKLVNFIKITGNANEVKVSNFKINRGNCSIINKPKQTVKLRFGQSLFLKHNCSSILEFEVDINNEKYIYSF